jgi:hypothetical protein
MIANGASSPQDQCELASKLNGSLDDAREGESETDE